MKKEIKIELYNDHFENSKRYLGSERRKYYGETY